MRDSRSEEFGLPPKRIDEEIRGGFDDTRWTLQLRPPQSEKFLRNSQWWSWRSDSTSHCEREGFGLIPTITQLVRWQIAQMGESGISQSKALRRSNRQAMKGLPWIAVDS